MDLRLFGRRWIWPFIYKCAGNDPYAYFGRCNLVYHPLFPPGVSVWTFIVNLATLWYPGLYDTGLTVGFFVVVGLLFIASRLNRDWVERIFSWPTAVGGGIILAIVGFYFEMNQTLAIGHPHVPSL